MIAQFIFFVALVLFLILLVRRFRATPSLLGRITGFFSNFGRGTIGLGRLMGSQVANQVRRVRQSVPRLINRPQATTKFSPPSLESKKLTEQVNEDQSFWHEEAKENTAEIPGFYDEGDELFKKGAYDQAEEFFLKAATRTPGDARVYARLGVIYLHAKNYNDAIEALKVAAKYDKYNPSRHYNLALAYHGNNDRQKAISSTREAIALDPVTKKYRSLLEQLLERK